MYSNILPKKAFKDACNFTDKNFKIKSCKIYLFFKQKEFLK